MPTPPPNEPMVLTSERGDVVSERSCERTNGAAARAVLDAAKLIFIVVFWGQVEMGMLVGLERLAQGIEMD